jgi:hypothetical protein
MVTSLPGSYEKVIQFVAKLLDRIEPRGEHRVTVIRQRVGALRRPREIGLPLRRDEPLVLEGAQCPVQVPDIDAIIARELGETLEEFIAVRRPIGQQDEERRLAEALDARPHLPAPVGALSAAAYSTLVATVHAATICELHM